MQQVWFTNKSSIIRHFTTNPPQTTKKQNNYVCTRDVILITIHFFVIHMFFCFASFNFNLEFSVSDEILDNMGKQAPKLLQTQQDKDKVHDSSELLQTRSQRLLFTQVICCLRQRTCSIPQSVCCYSDGQSNISNSYRDSISQARRCFNRSFGQSSGPLKPSAFHQNDTVSM